MGRSKIRVGATKKKAIEQQNAVIQNPDNFMDWSPQTKGAKECLPSGPTSADAPLASWTGPKTRKANKALAKRKAPEEEPNISPVVIQISEKPEDCKVRKTADNSPDILINCPPQSMKSAQEAYIADKTIDKVLRTLDSNGLLTCGTNHVEHLSIPKEIVASIPEEIVASIPEEIVASVPEEIVAIVPGEIVAIVPGEIVASVPEETVAIVPGEIVASVPEVIVASIPEGIVASITKEIVAVDNLGILEDIVDLDNYDSFRRITELGFPRVDVERSNTSLVVPEDFKPSLDIFNPETFKIIINGEDITHKFAKDTLSSYLSLCCSQKSFLHQNVPEGINPTIVMPVISQIVDIFNEMKKCNISTPRKEIRKWRNLLISFLGMGMEVKFLMNVVNKLLQLEATKAVERERSEKAEMESKKLKEKIQEYELEIEKLKEEKKNIDDENRKRTEALETMFKEATLL